METLAFQALGYHKLLWSRPLPSGVLFELATRDIGFTFDEPLETLGTELRLPPQHEHLRDELEHRLTPLPDPRAVDA